jgi:hypothetical protein
MILVAGTRDWLLSLFVANEFFATVASDVTKEGRNNFDKTPLFFQEHCSCKSLPLSALFCTLQVGRDLELTKISFSLCNIKNK